MSTEWKQQRQLLAEQWRRDVLPRAEAFKAEYLTLCKKHDMHIAVRGGARDTEPWVVVAEGLGNDQESTNDPPIMEPY